ncbi:MAG: sulfur oxidation c-type cytochrome SoxA [Gammaproteobacteria bacterium]
MLSFLIALAGSVEAEPLASGSTFLSEAVRAQQADEAANPGMLWVDEGAELWAQTVAEPGQSCAACHGEASDTMRGVATRYPAVDAVSGALLNLEGRINTCRREHQALPPLAYESDELLSLTAFVAYQSRGLAMQVETTGAAAPFHAAGRAFFHRRQGQLNLSCAHCHVRHAGRRMRGDIISHGLGNGYPIYRLEWQTLGSLHRRLRLCSASVRAVQFASGGPEYLALELYLAGRARDVAIETPAIRR